MVSAESTPQKTYTQFRRPPARARGLGCHPRAVPTELAPRLSCKELRANLVLIMYGSSMRLICKAANGDAYYVCPLHGRALDSWTGAQYGQTVKTDCRLVKISARGREREPHLKVEEKDCQERCDLLAYLSPLGGWVYWHRVLAFVFDNPSCLPYSSFANLEAHHADDKWWFVRRSTCVWRTGEENRAAQASAGLAGPEGQRPRKRAPRWARATWDD